ncbi:hypothetical protein AeNC1_017319, partial [Aphanomyces euteiches]
MKRLYTAKQVKDKWAKMKSEWSKSKPNAPKQTGNEFSRLMPAHYDLMLEYWGIESDIVVILSRRLKLPLRMAKMFWVGLGRFRRHEYVYQTVYIVIYYALEGKKDADGHHDLKRRGFTETRESKRIAKARTQADAIESGLFAIKDGLVSLGQSVGSKTDNEANNATLNQVLEAIQEQSAAMQAQAKIFERLLA